MKIVLVGLFILLGTLRSLAQETDNLESLTVPEDLKPAAQRKAETDLSLPSEKTASATIVKSNSSDSKKAAKENVGAILDFEGEVIEGERRRPDLFLQISIDNIKFDSLIYNRDDFNDYLEVDRKSRTRFLKMK
ncbi:MAG: hypothetical protein JNL11_16815 [Bdellovibrionaceae bacterium]|nr:hypothetical protein [Pseudobdellovibrionaceae bacterium]